MKNSIQSWSVATALMIAPIAVMAQDVASQDVVWNSPSANAHGSMPLGNGDVGVNAWVEASGDLVFYVSKTDAWDENGRLCKIGRVRVKFDPPLPTTAGFRQELKLRDGVIEIQSGASKLALWVDAHAPVVRVEADFDRPVTCRAEVELWRLRERPFGPDDDSFTGGGLSAHPSRPVVLPDTVVTSADPPIVWYHRNTRSVYPVCLQNQHLEGLAGKFPDPLLNHTFGASLAGEGMVRDGDRSLKSAAPAQRHALSLTVHAGRTDTPEAWLAQLDGLVKRGPTSRTEHEKWWQEFWARSWVSVDVPSLQTLPENAHPWRVGVDSGGGSRFGGQIVQPRVIGRALSADEIAQLSAAPRGEETKLQEENIAGGCTVVAWIKPAAGEAGRIFDKCTAGVPDGITLDTYPGLALRWIVGGMTMIHPNCLKPGEWQHVAATVDADGVRRIYLNGKPVMEERDTPAGETLNRGYVLQRFMNACSGRGVSPIKFNGSIFNVEASPGASPETPAGDPDWRQWGGNYWFQNTRLAYWPMLAAGDFEMMLPWFRMYRDALPMSLARIKNYYGLDNAAVFPETMFHWGLPNNGDFGWGHTGPEPANNYIKRYWNGSLELIAVMLDYYDFTQNEAFARGFVTPLADPLIAFLDQYWKRDANGKIRFDPSQSLETWHVAVNPMPEIAGLRSLLPRLIALPDFAATEVQRTRWARLLGELPPIPEADVNGTRMLRPAETFSNSSNWENPELYAVFPYRVYGVGRPGLEMARATYAAKGNRLNRGWCQDSIQAARLGLGEEAGQLVAARAAQINTAYRFPAMWGPNFDWIPDQDHGNNILTTLQNMLLQSVGDQIHVLPAWPKKWDVNFKLHAPRNTTVECVVRNGKIEKLEVLPPERRKDVILPDGIDAP